jgi:hypothetical protein
MSFDSLLYTFVFEKGSDTYRENVSLSLKKRWLNPKELV